MSFKEVGAMLQREGWQGARGAVLGANAIHSIYKKRKAHDQTRSAPVLYWITDIVVYPPPKKR